MTGTIVSPLAGKAMEQNPAYRPAASEISKKEEALHLQRLDFLWFTYGLLEFENAVIQRLVEFYLLYHHYHHLHSIGIRRSCFGNHQTVIAGIV